MKKPNGYVIYRGPSLLDGQPIVAIALTKKSKNGKTGNMVQTYILVDNGKSPLHNVYQLKDSSICGKCPHRRGTGGSCYVNISQGVTQVWKSYNKNNYPNNILQAKKESANRVVRLGTYGDPAAIPRYVWDNLLELSSGHTGYTHQWSDNKANHVIDLIMASVDSESDRVLAKKKGYRTFRIRMVNEAVMSGEFVCPASEEAGKRKLCIECKACDGGINTRKGDPVIISHGALKNRHNNHNGLVKVDMGAFDFLKKPFVAIKNVMTFA